MIHSSNSSKKTPASTPARATAIPTGPPPASSAPARAPATAATTTANGQGNRRPFVGRYVRRDTPIDSRRENLHRQNEKGLTEEDLGPCPGPSNSPRKKAFTYATSPPSGSVNPFSSADNTSRRFGTVSGPSAPSVTASHATVKSFKGAFGPGAFAADPLPPPTPSGKWPKRFVTPSPPPGSLEKTALDGLRNAAPPSRYEQQGIELHLWTPSRYEQQAEHENIPRKLEELYLEFRNTLPDSEDESEDEAWYKPQKEKSQK